MSGPPALRSFWMGGFEGSDHRNMQGVPLDLVRSTGHAASLAADYARLARHGMHVARESIGWRLAEPHGRAAGPGHARFDLRRTVAAARAAEDAGVQVLWTLMHYGMPADVDVRDDGFVERFVEYAAHVARTLAPLSAEPPVYTPINEISFLAWALCETSMMAPYVGDRRDPQHAMPDGFVVKRRLVQAALEAMAAMRREDPRCRFVHTDPLVHVVAPRDADPALAAEARRFREFQWQAWDMLAGTLEPQLGGSPQALDTLGINYYVTGQWEFMTGTTLPWPAGDGRRLPLHRLLVEAHARYRRPLLIAETGGCGDWRSAWVREVADEAALAIGRGVPLAGICLYPVIDRHDWAETDVWHQCGLWDAVPVEAATPAVDPTHGCTARHLCTDLARTLRELQSRDHPHPNVPVESLPEPCRENHRRAVPPALGFRLPAAAAPAVAAGPPRAGGLRRGAAAR